MLLRVPPFDVPDIVAAERNRLVVFPIGAKERTEQTPPFGRGVEAVGVVEDMAGLMAHVHHDLALVLERIDRLFELSQLWIGEVERNAEHRLLVRASPFVGQVADRTEFLEPAAVELLVQLPDVAFDR